MNSRLTHARLSVTVLLKLAVILSACEYLSKIGSQNVRYTDSCEEWLI